MEAVFARMADNVATSCAPTSSSGRFRRSRSTARVHCSRLPPRSLDGRRRAVLTPSDPRRCAGSGCSWPDGRWCTGCSSPRQPRSRPPSSPRPRRRGRPRPGSAGVTPARSSSPRSSSGPANASVPPTPARRTGRSRSVPADASSALPDDAVVAASIGRGEPAARRRLGRAGAGPNTRRACPRGPAG